MSWSCRYAIHGTSLEAVKYIIANGILPGSSQDKPDMHYQPGDISFFPTEQLQTLADEYHVRPFTDPLEPRHEAISYANVLAKKHGVLKRLGIPFGDSDAANAVPGVVYDNEDYFLAHGKTPEEIRAAVSEISDYNGFLLAFSPDIQTAPGATFTPGDPDTGDLNLRTGGKGLSYKYISGIEPLGPAEKAFMKKLIAQ